MESKEVTHGRNHNQWKRGIAAGHVRVVDYISPWTLFTGSSVFRQLFRVQKLSAIAFLLRTSIIAKNKNTILYFYIYMFLIVNNDTAEYTTHGNTEK